MADDQLAKYKAVCHWWYKAEDLGNSRNWTLNPVRDMTVAGTKVTADSKLAFIAVPCGTAADGGLNILLVGLHNQGRDGVKHTFGSDEWTVNANGVTFASAN